MTRRRIVRPERKAPAPSSPEPVVDCAPVIIDPRPMAPLVPRELWREEAAKHDALWARVDPRTRAKVERALARERARENSEDGDD